MFKVVLSMVLTPPILLITLSALNIHSLIVDEICVLLAMIYLLFLCPYLAVKY